MKYPGGDNRKEHAGGGLAIPPPACFFLMSPPGYLLYLGATIGKNTRVGEPVIHYGQSPACPFYCRPQDMQIN